MRQKNDGLTKYGFGWYKEIKGIWAEKNGVSTKYGFGLYKKIKRTEAKNN